MVPHTNFILKNGYWTVDYTFWCFLQIMNGILLNAQGGPFLHPSRLPCPLPDRTIWWRTYPVVSFIRVMEPLTSPLGQIQPIAWIIILAGVVLMNLCMKTEEIWLYLHLFERKICFSHFSCQFEWTYSSGWRFSCSRLRKICFVPGVCNISLCCVFYLVILEFFFQYLILLLSSRSLLC